MVDDKTTSAFNEGMLQIQRLDNIWRDLRTNREAGRLEKCKWILDSAEIELSEDIYIEDGEDEEKTKKSESYTSQLTKINNELEGYKDGDQKKEKKTLKASETYLLLRKKEKFLRRIQRLSGKGAKRKPIDDDEID